MPTIVGELKRHLRDTRWAAYVPQRMRERVLEVDRAAESLRRVLGRSPTAEEVAHEARIESAEVADALRPPPPTTRSRWTRRRTARRQTTRGHVLDSLGADEERYDMVEYAVTIAPALRALPARQRAILGLRFREDMTQAEIAARLGMSQMHVSRLLRQALGAVARGRPGRGTDRQADRLAQRPYHGGDDRSPRPSARLSEGEPSSKPPPQSEAQNDGKADSGEPQASPRRWHAGGPAAADPLPRGGRPVGARGAGGALPAARAAARSPLPAPERAARRPDAGREHGPREGHRPFRPQPRDRLFDLRRADDPRGAEALLPRLRVGRPRPARHAGAGDEARPGLAGAASQAGPLARPPRSWPTS